MDAVKAFLPSTEKGYLPLYLFLVRVEAPEGSHSSRIVLFHMSNL